MLLTQRVGDREEDELSTRGFETSFCLRCHATLSSSSEYRDGDSTGKLPDTCTILTSIGLTGPQLHGCRLIKLAR